MKKQVTPKRFSLTIIATAISSLLYMHTGYAAYYNADTSNKVVDDNTLKQSSEILLVDNGHSLTFTNGATLHSFSSGVGTLYWANVLNGGKVIVDGKLDMDVTSTFGNPIVSVSGTDSLFQVNGDVDYIIRGYSNQVGFNIYDNAKLEVTGLTKIDSSDTTSTAPTGISASQGTVHLNELIMTGRYVAALAGARSSEIVVTGDTIINASGTGIRIVDNSLISVGTNNNIEQHRTELLNDSTKSRVFVGENAIIDTAIGIGVLTTDIGHDTYISVKGQINAIYALNARGGNEHMHIDGGNVIGDLYFDFLRGDSNSASYKGNDSLAITSGTYSGEAYMGAGNDHVELSGGTVTGIILMGEGKDTAKISGNPNLTGLKLFSGGADGTVDNTGEITLDGQQNKTYRFVGEVAAGSDLLLQNWNKINLTNGSSVTLKGSRVLVISDIDNAWTQTTFNEDLSDQSISLNSLNIDSTSTLNYDQDVATQAIYGSVDNNGTMTFGDNTEPGRIWNVKGNYSGTGTIVFNTVLSDDISVTDKLIINGDTSGTTKVKVNNVGGEGAVTNQGIELIVVNGNSAKNAFVQDGRIIGGAYDYKLQQGDAFGTNMNNWYLTSYLSPNKPTLRPEGGAYVGMQEYNRTAFNHSFHDRQQLLNNAYESSWGRIVYTQTKYKVGADDQLDTKTHKTLIHLGSDFYQDEQLHLGIMGGYSNGNLTSRSNVTHYRADGQSDGYSLGLYGTWFDQAEKQEGWYVDSWLQYNWFKNRVSGQELSQKKYKIHGISASLETGYGFILNEESLKPENQEQTTWTLEPQAQIIYNNLSGAKFTDSRNTYVKSDSGDMYTFRAGLRLQGRNESGFQPFATLNYWYTNNRSHIDMDSVRVDSHHSRYLWNAKVGGQLPLAKDFVAYGEIQGGLGAKSTKMFGGDIGLKYTW